MSHLRRINGLLTVLALLVPILLLTGTPAAAQDDDEPAPPLTVFVFRNVMTNADRPFEPDEQWQVRVSIRPLSGCVPTRGDGAHDTYWIDARGEAGARLSLTECVFNIAAIVRDASEERGCNFPALLAWGRQPNEADEAVPNEDVYVEGSLLTTTRPDGESRLSIRREPGSACARANRTNFVIHGRDIVESLPAASNDGNLLALARRAAQLTEFDVRVAPDPSADVTLPPGCDRTTTVAVPGDGLRAPAVLHSATGSCPLRATGAHAPAPFEAPHGGGVTFDGAGLNILVDVTRLVRLRPARIVIIQDVTGSVNRGEVSYAITRSCGDASTSLPTAGGATSPLYDGRYTVHGPHVPVFGASATYAVGATSGTSSTVVGCSVTVTISGVPAGCSVASGPTQTLTWSADAPFEHFDFEFDIRCAGGAAPAPPPQPPATTPAEDLPAEDAEFMAEDAELMTEMEDTTALDAQPEEADGPPRDAPTG